MTPEVKIIIGYKPNYPTYFGRADQIVPSGDGWSYFEQRPKMYQKIYLSHPKAA